MTSCPPSRGLARDRPGDRSAAARRICAIHQPHYLPWPRYFHKIAAADVFILLDDVQYSKNGWQNRNRIKGPNGPFLLTVPIQRGLRPIREVEIAGDHWRERHLRSLSGAYRTCPGYPALEAAIGPILDRSWRSLADLDAALLAMLLDLLDITTPVLRSSELAPLAVATDRLLELCRATDATHYLSGRFALDAYLEPEVLAAGGVELLLQDWTAPSYQQPHSRAGFVPDLSIVDLVAAAPDAARDLLLGAGRVRHA